MGDEGRDAAVVWRRYAQFVIESVLLVVAGLVAFAVFLGVAILLIQQGAPPELFLVLPFAALIVLTLAGTLWLTIWYPYRHDGATPAMRWLGLRIVTLRGTAPSLKDYAVRWLLMVVDGLFLGLVGAVLIAVTPRHQRFGDIVARTVVVRAGGLT